MDLKKMITHLIVGIAVSFSAAVVHAEDAVITVNYPLDEYTTYNGVVYGMHNPSAWEFLFAVWDFESDFEARNPGINLSFEATHVAHSEVNHHYEYFESFSYYENFLAQANVDEGWFSYNGYSGVVKTEAGLAESNKRLFTFEYISWLDPEMTHGTYCRKMSWFAIGGGSTVRPDTSQAGHGCLDGPNGWDFRFRYYKVWLKVQEGYGGPYGSMYDNTYNKLRLGVIYARPMWDAPPAK